MRIQKLSHSTYQHLYHLVWGTKYRRRYLKPYVKEELLAWLHKELKKYPTLRLDVANVDEDHIHLQVEIPPNVLVSRVVQILKSGSSRMLLKKFPFIRRMYVENSVWSVGYFSSTVGLNEEVIRRYIERQDAQEYPEETSF